MAKAFSWLWAIGYPPVEFSTGKGCSTGLWNRMFLIGIKYLCMKKNNCGLSTLGQITAPSFSVRWNMKYLSLLEYCVAQRHISGARFVPERQRMGSEINVPATQNRIIPMAMSVLCPRVASSSLPLGTEFDESHTTLSHCSLRPSLKMLTWLSRSGYLGDTELLIVRQWGRGLISCCLRGKKAMKPVIWLFV